MSHAIKAHLFMVSPTPKHPAAKVSAGQRMASSPLTATRKRNESRIHNVNGIHATALLPKAKAFR